MPHSALDTFWLPFTDNRRFLSHPRVLASAKGMYYQDTEGRSILDGVSGLWCAQAGHGREEIAQAICRAAGHFGFGLTMRVSNEYGPAATAAIAAHMPAGLDRILLTNSGSEAIEVALKTALTYHRARGRRGLAHFIARDRTYHGTTWGATSVSGVARIKDGFMENMMPGVKFIRSTKDETQRFVRGQPESHEAYFEELIALIEDHGERIAGVILDPVVGSDGLRPPPKGYLERVRQITEDYGIVLIFDEVTTGFGRLGTNTASHRFGITPDMIAFSKGLANGVVPIGGVAVRREIRDAIFDAAPAGAAELEYGHTYSGTPVPCAAALATLDIYRNEGLFARVAAMEPELERRAHALHGLPHVIDIRNIGLIAAIELAPRPGPISRALEVFERCLDAGVLVRANGPTVVVAPPFIVTEAQIDEIVGTIGQALRVVG